MKRAIRKPRRACQHPRPTLEPLESRQLLAVFQVINTNEDGPGSLRQALFQTITSPGPDDVNFALEVADPNFDPATTTWTIRLSRPLVIEPGSLQNNPVFVDAASQPQYAALQRPVVQLAPVAGKFNGDAALIVASGGSKVRGLAINRFPLDGLSVLSDNNALEANFIGTDVTGQQALPNGRNGLALAADNNTIGGGNVISANKQNGIALFNASRNLVIANRIGTSISGREPLPNGENGVLIDSSSGTSADNVIGGLEVSGANTIAFNSAAGVVVDGGGRNAILVNSIFQNAQAGIVLRNNGNNNQAAPRIDGVVTDAAAGITEISYVLQSVPSREFRLRFYANPAGIANPQGRSFLGETTTTTNAAGTVSDTVGLAAAVPLGALVTATATLVNSGNTSPFSNAVAAVAADDFVVINTNDSGRGSLRQVMINANNAPGFNTVRFNIPGAGVHTIRPLTTLPAINETVSIDAGTQPGFAGTPLVVVDGSRTAGDGFIVRAANTTIKNLVIQGFVDAGILVRGAGFSRLEGLYVGTNAAGNASRPNGIGILIEDSPNAVIGGLSPDQANVISGNRTAGIYIRGGKSAGAVIAGNKIGTDVSGNRPIVRGKGANLLDDLQQTGVVIVNASDVIVGGETAAARNVISGNYVGVMIARAGGNLVWGNFIGTNSSGQAPLGNIVGVYINRSANNLIGGAQAGRGNVISGNRQTGLEIFGPGAGNQVAGNIIGLGADGRTVLRRGGQRAQTTGIFILNGSNNQIGGTNQAAQNIISGNASSGVFIQARNGQARGNTVERNLIGPDIGGASGPGNGVYGVVLYNAPGNTITQTGPNANRFFDNPGGNIRDFRGSAVGATRLRTRRVR